MNKKQSTYILFLMLFLFLIACEDNSKTVIFSAIGDVPYTLDDASALETNIIKHNKKDSTSFVIHLGDIKSGSTPCEEAIYINVANILKKFSAPVYIIPGDNEYNDCKHPKEAFAFWNRYFFHFHENWSENANIQYQPAQKENFAWREGHILFVGLNLLGGRIHDSNEWQERLNANAKWIEQSLKNNDKSIEAMVIFGHANLQLKPEKYKIFTKKFRAIAALFDKPILYLHGDGHVWIKDRPWKEQNILRVQVDAGAEILQVTVNPDLPDPFRFTRSKK
jgi:predicted phosphodiesterase